MLFLIDIDPYDIGGATENNYGYNSYDFKLPSKGYNFDMLISNNLILIFPSWRNGKYDANFNKFYRKTLFYVRICHFREYTNEETG